jgi:hypothetical protein
VQLEKSSIAQLQLNRNSDISDIYTLFWAVIVTKLYSVDIYKQSNHVSYRCATRALS